MVDPALGPPLDGSQEGRLIDGPGLVIADTDGARLTIEAPADWPGPHGEIRLGRPLVPGAGNWRREARGLAWHDDLGGMGAGFAAALGATLICALGDAGEPIGVAVAGRLTAAGIDARPIRVPGHPSDWTLLVTSAGFGDKLPIGFRGCHDAVESLAGPASACDLRVVASWPNRLAAQALRAPGAGIRLFAPAMRNVIDPGVPLASFADAIDVLCLNRREWEALGDDGPAIARRVALVAITDGPAGAIVRARRTDGSVRSIHVPAFPRATSPVDTNRAGETFASTLIAYLLDEGWFPGLALPDLLRDAARRAAAAAALQLDLPLFGFPTASEIDAVLRLGRVLARDGDPNID